MIFASATTMRNLLDDELRRVLCMDPHNATALEEMRSRFVDGMRTDVEYIAELESDVDSRDVAIETLESQVSALEQAFQLFCS
jgi:hypothetical protein